MIWKTRRISDGESFSSALPAVLWLLRMTLGEWGGGGRCERESGSVGHYRVRIIHVRHGSTDSPHRKQEPSRCAAYARVGKGRLCPPK